MSFFCSRDRLGSSDTVTSPRNSSFSSHDTDDDDDVIIDVTEVDDATDSCPRSSTPCMSDVTPRTASQHAQLDSPLTSQTFASRELHEPPSTPSIPMFAELPVAPPHSWALLASLTPAARLAALQLAMNPLLAHDHVFNRLPVRLTPPATCFSLSDVGSPWSPDLMRGEH